MAKEKFETKLKKLEEIVNKLESGEIDLDESIKLYEDGLKLSKELTKQLETYDSKINEITKENDK